MNLTRELNDYCADVLSGRRIAGQLQIAAVQRFQADLKRSKDSDWPYYFDEAAATLPIRFAGLLKHSTSDFDQKPFHLEPWQKFIVGNIYGWRRKENRRRRFRNVYIEIGRKNGKTALAAVLALNGLVLDGEARAEVYAAATKRKQSKLVWEEADRFRKSNDWLNERIKPTPSRHLMTGMDGSIFTALGGDGGGDDGYNPSLVIFDELHEWKREGHIKLWEKLRTGSSMRGQPLFVITTTAGDTKSYLWKQERAYASAVATGQHTDDSLFSFVCCLDPDDDIFDEDNWPKANPGLYTIKQPTDMRDLATKARWDAKAERELKRYHLNLMVEPTAQGISAASWKKGAKPLPELTGRICYGGLDLGWINDLAAFWLVFPPENKHTGTFYTLGWAFCPQSGDRDLTQGEYPEWIKAGLLIATPGTETDIVQIKHVIEQARKKYKLKAIALDQNNARQIGQELQNAGVEVVSHGQKGIHYNEPLRSLKSCVNDGRFIHGDNKLLTWCIENMVVATSGGLMRPAKEHSRDKIDPAVAMLMGYSCSILGTGNTKPQTEVRVRYA